MAEISQEDDEYTVTLDDDVLVPRLIERILGKRTLAFSSTVELRRSYSKLKPIGAFIDIHLGDGSCGLDILPGIKAHWPTCPIIVITADDSEALIGRALAMGADDFIAKPIRPGELVARFMARKYAIDLRSNQTVLQYGDVTLNLLSKSLSGPRGKRFPSAREVEILALLMRSPNLIIKKSNLKSTFWAGIAVSDNAVDRKIFEIRKVISDVSDTIEIHSLYGHGIELRQKPDRI